MAFASGVVGNPGAPIEDVTFSGVHVRSVGGGSEADATREVPERVNSSLEPSFMGILPAYGLYVRHARNVSLNDVSFEVERRDARPAILFDDVSGAIVDGLRSPHPSKRAVRTVRSDRITLGHLEQLIPDGERS
jgi:hypothetical protein